MISRCFMAVQRRAEPGVATRSAEWVANGKAVTVRALASAAVLARDARNPEAIRILNDLNAIRGRLAQLAMARDTDGSRPVAERKGYKKLAEQELELSRQLGLALGNPVVDPWATLSDLRARYQPTPSSSSSRRSSLPNRTIGSRVQPVQSWHDTRRGSSRRPASAK